jgi:hypothetical protein
MAVRYAASILDDLLVTCANASFSKRSDLKLKGLHHFITPSATACAVLLSSCAAMSTDAWSFEKDRGGSLHGFCDWQLTGSVYSLGIFALAFATGYFGLHRMGLVIRFHYHKISCHIERFSWI